jgi:predicted O-methyltransferase YrrM
MSQDHAADAERYLAERRNRAPKLENAWSDVDTYIGDNLLAGADPVLEAVLRANAAGGLPAIDVSPAQGKFLNLLVTIAGAKRILEIGTLGAYSTIWMAKALPAGGAVVTLEYAPKHAAVAKDNLARAGLLDRVEVLVGPALDSLPKLSGTFDLVFIDADKPNNSNYLQWALKLSHPGTIIILDNVVRDGRVLDASSGDANVEGARSAFELIRTEPRLDATALQTVGLKGWDGFVLAVVR